MITAMFKVPYQQLRAHWQQTLADFQICVSVPLKTLPFLSNKFLNLIQCLLAYWIVFSPHLGNIYLLKGNNRNTTKTCEISSKLTIKTPERRQLTYIDAKWRLDIFHTLFLVFLLLTLNKSVLAGQFLYLFIIIDIIRSWSLSDASMAFFIRTSKVLMRVNVPFLRFSASKSYYVHVFYETFSAVNGDNNTWR